MEIFFVCEIVNNIKIVMLLAISIHDIVKIARRNIVGDVEWQ